MRDLDNIFLEQRIRELEKNGTGGGSSADKISYDNTESGLTSNTVQGAIDEVHEEVENIKHHYSTEEKIVGEWVDGSLICEKTYIFSVEGTSSEYVKELETFNNNISPMKLEGFVINSNPSSSTYNNVFALPYKSLFNVLGFNPTTKKLTVNVGDWGKADVNITVTYIKNE